jgi:Polysaccharide deacetylase
MKKRTAIVAVAALCALGVLVGAFTVPHGQTTFAPDADRLLLLLPDGTSFSDPRVTVWVDAAVEEGLHVVPMHDSTYVSPLSGRPRCAGLILPDTIHVKASDVLVGAIRDYVANGGKLMLVYDAGIQSLQGFYTKDQSRLSDLAGVHYALYSSLGAGMIQAGDVSGTIAAMNSLGVPPGKYYPLAPSAAEGDPPENGAMEVELRRYEYGDLEYPSFVTSGSYSGEVLMRTKAGLAAGSQRFEDGSVLFVNLPLGFLEGYTDGLPLHAFLKYFATKMLSLPELMPVPDGIGGLVLNWHVDSNAAIKPLEEMRTWTIVKQGPFSVDITAGPDTYAIGDKKGFDVLHNAVSQELIHYYEALGYEIGSHGGWIHNYFGELVADNNANEMTPFLQLNNDALRAVTGKPVREYSAPVGNQPQWVTRWLEKHGVVAYYFTGDTGMGPTIGYRREKRAGQTIWAFPILHLDRAASFEEMPKYNYPDDLVAQWLAAATDFTVNQRQVRLIYFHPPGVLRYHQVINTWMEKTAQLKAQGVFRWYTMAQMADFLNARQTVKWKISRQGNSAVLDAEAVQTLDHETWRLPKDSYGQPHVTQGIGKVVADGDSWLVIAGNAKRLRIETGIIGK